MPLDQLASEASGSTGCLWINQSTFARLQPDKQTFGERMDDDDTRVDPPEVREPQEPCRLIEFYVDLASPRPELQLIEIVSAWLRGQPPLTVMNLSFAYQPGDDDQPSLLVGNLIVGQPLDFG